VLKDEKGMSACYNNLGLIAQETGNYNDALLLYQKSIDLDMKLGDKIGIVSTKRNLIDIFMYKGNPKQALILCNEILLISKDISDKDGFMRSLINRAAIYEYIQKFDEALEDQKAAIKIAQELNDKYTEAVALSNLGLVTWRKGNPDEALRVLNEVLEMSDGIDNGYDVLNTLWIMADIYSFKQDFNTSNAMLLKVLKKYENVGNRREEAKVLTSFGRNLLELNELDKSIAYLKKSLEITVDLDTPYEKLENYKNLGHAYAVLHDFKKADSLQELFAQTYSVLSRNDSIDVEIADNAKGSLHIEQFENKSISSKSDWIVAFLLFVLVVLLSMLVYNKSSTQNHSKLE
jgi:tetratricopeptide (TPR) repeat protein